MLRGSALYFSLIHFLGNGNGMPTGFVDLTLTLNKNTVVWPSFKPFQLNNLISKYVLEEPKQW